MASRGRGRRGRPRGTGQAPPIFDQPPVFDQQTFAEAVGVAVAAIAQASIAGSQGGPSNLQRFRAHHPSTFTGGEDPMVADHWFMHVTPQTRGSVDYPSTRGNTRECRVTRHFSRKSGRVSFVQGALPKYNTCISCPKQCNIIQYIQSHE